MKACEVLIVGGGPAGSSCAWKLRKSGVDVIVLDKAQFPRNKVCAGWITPPIVEELDVDLKDYQHDRILQPITRFVTGLIDGPEVETVYNQTVSYGIRRCEFDDYLLRRSDAQLKLGEPFQSMRSEGAEWVVNEAYRARIVVGAGGHFCPVARLLAADKMSSEATRPETSSLPVVVAQEVEFEMSDQQQTQCTVQPDRPELYFCPDLKGYGWVFRKGDFLNVGLGREGEERLAIHVAEFVEFLRKRNKVTFPLERRFQGHAYYLRTRLPSPPQKSGVLLIGDALGLADCQSGEGIRPAIESGLLAAASILQDAAASEGLNAGYRRRLEDRFPSGSGWEFVTGRIPSSVRQFAAGRLMSTRWFTRRVVLDRWFLHVAQTPLRHSLT